MRAGHCHSLFFEGTSVSPAFLSCKMHPAKAVHWDGSAGNEPVIVQIIGEGPAQTVQLDAKQPMWRVVSH
jgi:hypothetical protein